MYILIDVCVDVFSYRSDAFLVFKPSFHRPPPTMMFESFFALGKAWHPSCFKRLIDTSIAFAHLGTVITKSSVYVSWTWSGRSHQDVLPAPQPEELQLLLLLLPKMKGRNVYSPSCFKQISIWMLFSKKYLYMNFILKSRDFWKRDVPSALTSKL